MKLNSLSLLVTLLTFGSMLLAQAAPAGDVHLTLLATNDIHGGVEPSTDKDGNALGGMALWSGVVSAIRGGLANRSDEKAGTLVIDAGDQFQGTLISNYDEGQLVFATMNQIGYDAVIPGNHDFDFGPIGWLVDQSSDPSKRREALERLVKQAKFPLLSANTYLKNSIVDFSGTAVAVDGSRCKPLHQGTAIDWSQAKRPAIFQPWLIKEVAGVRVALIGIDNSSTPLTTTADNVSDLCFEDEFTAYKAARAELADQADVFVLVVHDGNAGNEHGMTTLVQKIVKSGGGVDAVISGHTHYVYNIKVSGVPVIQSGFGGTRFGRIDLYWNARKRQLTRTKTVSYGGIKLFPDRCDDRTESFCSTDDDGTLRYEGARVQPNASIVSLISQARAVINPMAKRVVGHADKELRYERIDESPLADVISDAFRAATGADIAFVNTGGLRAPIEAGEVDYEDLFHVLPFNNHAVQIGPMSTDSLLDLLRRAVRTCGSYGALMQSGLHVTYHRDCARSAGVDSSADIDHVETIAGTVIFDNGSAQTTRSFQVATFDFLASGGSGYSGFKTLPLIKDFGVLREILAQDFYTQPFHWDGAMDGRWKLTTGGN